MPSSRKGPHQAALTEIGGFYRVDSISNPQASRRGSGMYLEFLFLRAHSRRRVERMYWSGWSLYSCTTCSNSVIVGTTGPIGSGLPQLGLPRRLAMKNIPSRGIMTASIKSLSALIPRRAPGIHPEKGKPVRQILAPSAHLEAIDNNRFLYVSQ